MEEITLNRQTGADLRAAVRLEKEAKLAKRTKEAQAEFQKALDGLKPSIKRKVLTSIKKANRIGIKGRAQGLF